MLYLVTFDITSPEYDWQAAINIYNKIKTLGNDYHTILDKVVLIYSEQPLDIEAINAEFIKTINTQYNLFIAEINPNNVDGWLVKSSWDFVKKYRQ